MSDPEELERLRKILRLVETHSIWTRCKGTPFYINPEEGVTILLDPVDMVELFLSQLGEDPKAGYYAHVSSLVLHDHGALYKGLEEEGPEIVEQFIQWADLIRKLKETLGKSEILSKLERTFDRQTLSHLLEILSTFGIGVASTTENTISREYVLLQAGHPDANSVMKQYPFAIITQDPKGDLNKLLEEFGVSRCVKGLM